jgi:hypothetical protein
MPQQQAEPTGLFDPEVRAMSEPAQIRDSNEVAKDIASGGNLKFYWHTFKSNPTKVIVGVWDSLIEVMRWLLLPRFRLDAGLFTRMRLLWDFIRAELNIPGGTTCLEAIWLTYAASMPKSSAVTWIEVGCFKGLSVVRLSQVARLLGKRIRVYDTFEGLPASDPVYNAVVGGLNYELKEGSYQGTIEEVQRNVEKFGAPELVSLIKGDVRRTLPDPALDKISFAFFDVDLVESYKSCFAGIARHIEPGTTIAFHEASFKEIRNLVGDPALWNELRVPAPEVVYFAEKYRVRSLLNLAILRW